MEASSLLVIFLRGGADGLALVPPYADPALASLRPTLASAAPDDTRTPAARRIVDLDGRFGLHPALAPLAPLARDGGFAIVHAVGSDDDTRSHFEAQDRMERAGLTATSSASGWIARHLVTRPGPPPGPLAAISFGAILPESLRGHSATAIERLDEVAGSLLDPAALASLSQLYAEGGADAALPLSVELGSAGRDAIAVSRALADVARAERGQVVFPDSPLGRQLCEAALLLRHRRELGVEVITIDHGGWDTHFVQGEAVDRNAADLASSLVAFREALADAWADTTVLVMTEFGRRAYENVSLGTDHGRGSVAFVLGGRVAKRGVVGPWKGIAPDQLDAPGDLSVLTDFRDVLADAVEHALQNPRAVSVVPGAKPGNLSLFG